jgi:hypothetical protein
MSTPEFGRQIAFYAPIVIIGLNHYKSWINVRRLCHMFKVCSMCKFDWQNELSFLRDAGVSYYGYQVFTEKLEEGLFLFEHACGTTLSVFVESFLDLYNGPVYEKSLMGTKECPGYCLDEKETRLCVNECNCAHVRHIMQKLLNPTIEPITSDLDC